MYGFLSQSNAVISNGVFRRLVQIIKDDGYDRPCIIIDEGFKKTKSFLDFHQDFTLCFPNSDGVVVTTSGQKEPTYPDLEKHRAELSSADPDLILGIGGGSAMDTAKALAALLTNKLPAIEYRGFDKLETAGIDCYLVPTTAGTGSEASYNASFVDEDTNRKMGINGKFMFAAKSFLDGELIGSCPRFASLGAAVDAVTHAVEGIVCNNSNKVTDAIALSALKLLWKGLDNFEHEETSDDNWLDLLVGAHLAGIVQMNSGSGVAAAISYPLSCYFSVPHGIGGGMFLWDVARFNVLRGVKKYDTIASAIGSELDGQDLIALIDERFGRIGVPENLGHFNIRHENYDFVCKIMRTQQPAFDQNPVRFDAKLDFPKFIESYLEV